jgi:chemotaxis protein MotB
MPAPQDKKVQPIVVKRIKKAAHGHHGGAWKIAYADFVTAMMAFFLLMWLLGSTTKGDLKGIADYFNTPLKVALAGGSGSGDSSSILKGGGADLTRTYGQVKRGEIDADRKSINLQALKADQRRMEREQLKLLAGKVEQAINASPKLADLRSQIKLDLTAEGLRIQIVDDQNRPMFDSGSAVVKPYMHDLLREIGRVLNDVPNRVTLSGHTDATVYSAGERGYSNWELSADRANASRRELVGGGMDEAKVLRVVGLGSAVPYDLESPRSPANRRISIIVMNKEAERRVLEGDRLDSGDGESEESAGIPSAGQTPGIASENSGSAGTPPAAIKQ